VQPVAASRSVLIRCLAVEADELWSFVQKKANPHWVWIAMEKQTRQIIAFHVGDRSRDSAKQLWAKIPAVYREQATFYTDHYVAYTGVIPTVNINPSLSSPVTLTTSSDSITRCARGSHGSCAARWLSPKT
jgi:IS1 family transposase